MENITGKRVGFKSLKEYDNSYADNSDDEEIDLKLSVSDIMHIISFLEDSGYKYDKSLAQYLYKQLPSDSSEPIAGSAEDNSQWVIEVK